MTEEIIKEYLKCLLTDKEMKKEAEKMANCFSKLSELEATLKSAKKQIESDMARVEAELGSSVEKYRSGFEMCNVDCRIDKDFQTNTLRMIRLDTFETIRERPLSAEERQMMLDLEKKEETPASEEKQEGQLFDQIEKMGNDLKKDKMTMEISSEGKSVILGNKPDLPEDANPFYTGKKEQDAQTIK